jgi:hypothetical protein
VRHQSPEDLAAWHKYRRICIEAQIVERDAVRKAREIMDLAWREYQTTVKESK